MDHMSLVGCQGSHDPRELPKDNKHRLGITGVIFEISSLVLAHFSPLLVIPEPIWQPLHQALLLKPHQQRL